eukprot:377585-Hanusia_phi.AAC.1
MFTTIYELVSIGLSPGWDTGPGRTHRAGPGPGAAGARQSSVRHAGRAVTVRPGPPAKLSPDSVTVMMITDPADTVTSRLWLITVGPALAGSGPRPAGPDRGRSLSVNAGSL